jgi:hypothetical protein
VKDCNLNQARARTQETLKRDGRAKLQAASSKRKKYLTGPVNCETIPYNLKKGKIMDYLTLRIPADTDQQMTSTTWTGEPPFQGSNGMYEQINCNLCDVVPALYYDAKNKHELEGELYVDDEGLLKNRPRNWRATQLRFWYFSKKGLTGPELRDYCNIAGDAVFMIKATDANIKMMEAILDS